MRYYLASLLVNIKSKDYYPVCYPLLEREQPYYLESFFYLEKEPESLSLFQDHYPKSPDRFMLDSGAFSFINQRKAMVSDIDAYTDRYIDFVNEYNPVHFFEMDVDSVYGVEKARQLRHRIEDGTGRQPIPVWHSVRGKEAFVEMCRSYPYVAIGMPHLIREHGRSNVTPILPWFVNTAHKHGAQIHALGLSMLDVLLSCRFDSCDATSWIISAAFGQVARFNGREIVNQKCTTHRTERKDVVPHNLREYIKLQNYLERTT